MKPLRRLGFLTIGLFDEHNPAQGHSVVRAEDDTPDFGAIQLTHVTEFREHHPEGRISQDLVVIPTDSATPEQRAQYAAYAAKRLPQPQGPGRLLFSPDYVGTSEELAEQLAFREIDEVAFALPSWARHSAGSPLRTPGARATQSASPEAHRPAPA